MDFHLPFYNGLECIKYIRQMEREEKQENIIAQGLLGNEITKPSMIIGFSSINEQLIEADFLREGADCFISKPTQLQILREKIFELLSEQ